MSDVAYAPTHSDTQLTPEQRAVTLSAAAIRYRTLHKMGMAHNREMLEAWREFVSLLDAEIEGSGRG